MFSQWPVVCVGMWMGGGVFAGFYDVNTPNIVGWTVPSPSQLLAKVLRIQQSALTGTGQYQFAPVHHWKVSPI